MTAPGNAKVAIVMGSQSDWETMTCADEVLGELGVATDVRIVSAHRTPDRMYDFAKRAAADGFEDLIPVAILGAIVKQCPQGLVAAIKTVFLDRVVQHCQRIFLHLEGMLHLLARH